MSGVLITVLSVMSPLTKITIYADDKVVHTGRVEDIFAILSGVELEAPVATITFVSNPENHVHITM